MSLSKLSSELEGKMKQAAVVKNSYLTHAESMLVMFCVDIAKKMEESKNHPLLKVSVEALLTFIEKEFFSEDSQIDDIDAEDGEDEGEEPLSEELDNLPEAKVPKMSLSSSIGSSSQVVSRNKVPTPSEFFKK